MHHRVNLSFKRQPHVGFDHRQDNWIGNTQAISWKMLNRSVKLNERQHFLWERHNKLLLSRQTKAPFRCGINMRPERSNHSGHIQWWSFSYQFHCCRRKWNQLTPDQSGNLWEWPIPALRSTDTTHGTEILELASHVPLRLLTECTAGKLTSRLNHWLHHIPDRHICDAHLVWGVQGTER